MFHNMLKMQQVHLNNQIAFVNINQRAFGGKKKKSDDAPTEDEATVEEVAAEPVPEPVVEETPAAPEPPAEPKPDFSAASSSQPAAEVSKDLFGSFSVGSITQTKSAPHHKPPISEDTIEGRYAGVLFSTASEQEALYLIYEDLVYLKGLYDNSEAFYLFTQNGGVGSKEVKQFNEALQSVATFHPLTIKFLEILAENKRLSFIGAIAGRYQKLYQLLNKEEKITIISAEPLNKSESDEVLAALKANPNNAGKEFKLEFTIDPLIKGGLQMYTETEFMDMSLQSRLDKLKNEVSRFVE